MKYQLIAVASLVATSAFAQTPQPQTFVPWTVTEQDSQQIATFLGDVPSKFANPILQWMGQREQQAQQQAQAEKAQADKAAADKKAAKGTEKK